MAYFLGTPFCDQWPTAHALPTTSPLSFSPHKPPHSTSRISPASRHGHLLMPQPHHPYKGNTFLCSKSSTSVETVSLLLFIIIFGLFLLWLGLELSSTQGGGRRCMQWAGGLPQPTLYFMKRLLHASREGATVAERGISSAGEYNGVV